MISEIDFFSVCAGYTNITKNMIVVKLCEYASILELADLLSIKVVDIQVIITGSP